MSRKDSPKMVERREDQAKRRVGCAETRRRKKADKLNKIMAKDIADSTGANKNRVYQVLSAASLIHLFEDVDDFRDQNKITYRLSDLLIMTFFAICEDGSCEFENIANHVKVHEDEYIEMGLLHDGRRPEHDTFRTVFCNMDPDSLRDNTVGAIYELLKRHKCSEGGIDHWAIDGKEVCGTGRGKDTKNPSRHTNVLNLYDVTRGVNIFNDLVDKKTNEIPTARDMLFPLDIKGKLITTDALHCTDDTCELIDWKGGYYVFPVKDKRRAAFKQIKEIFEDKSLRGRKKHVIEDRVFEVYKLGKTRSIDDIPTVKTVVKMISYTRGMKTEPTVMYFISNSTKVEEILEAICNRWEIENGLHKLKDSTLINEDGIRFRNDTALRNMTVMTDLIAALVTLYRKMNDGMKLAIAKKTMRAYPVKVLEAVLDNLGDEEFVLQLKSVKSKPSSRKKAALRKQLEQSE